MNQATSSAIRQPKPEPRPRVGAVLFARDGSAARETDWLIYNAGVQSIFIEFRANLMNSNDVYCDIALVLFDGTLDFAQYIHEMALLKIVKKIPVVIALIPSIHQNAVKNHQTEIAADAVLFLPMDTRQFGDTIKQFVRKINSSAQKNSGRSELRRTSQYLGEMLVQNGIIDAIQLKKALDYQQRSGHRLGDTLIELGYIEEEQKLHFLAMQLGVNVASLQQYASVDITVVSLIPEHIARRHNCIALEKDASHLVVAMTDVLDLRLLDILRDLADLTIIPILGKTEDITASIERYYQEISSHKDATNIIADWDDKVEYVQTKDDDVDLEQVVADGAEVGIVKLVNMLITNAVRDRASDIHIEPMEKDMIIRYRIDGDLRKIMSPPKKSHPAIITRIKILSDLDIAERRLPQDGRMVVKLGSREVDIRVSILPSIFGEKAVLRILDKEAFEKSLVNLGFSDHDLKTFKKQITKPYGMIIVTGPTGSGKSTTLYSGLQSIKNIKRNIITVEDPVEFHIDGVTQVNVNPRIGLSFAAALRSILRQDPDIVLIGEIRDHETADIAVKMSLTGHLVFSSLHTNDAVGAVARFVDIGIPPLLLSSALNVVIAQRLVRRICTKCKVEYTPPRELVASLCLEELESSRFFRGEGCVSCNGTGFSGRTALFEMLAISKDIRRLILRNASGDDIKSTGVAEGMKTLRQAGIESALRGETTIEQVLAVTAEI